MPCNSAYMNPTMDEENSKEAARLLAFIYRETDRDPSEFEAISRNYYGDTSRLDEMVREICTCLRNLQRDDAEKFESIVYNAKNPDSRRLADWWEEHVEADRQREIKEAEKKAAKAEKAKQKELAKKALAKLTTEEREALMKRIP